MTNRFSERSLKVCSEFLQTAVIIDDKLLLKNPVEPKILSETPGRSQTSLLKDWFPKKTAIKECGLDAQALTKSFAEHGIICGALDFKDYENDSIAFIKTAKRADIVIIDWEMEKEKTGINALNLISRLLSDDLKSPQRFRLISIYTASPDLSSISAAIHDHIEQRHKLDFDKNDQELCLRYHSITIIIYAKEKHGIPDHFIGSVVNEKELPAKLISFFSQSVNGLLPNTALAALTALRNNSHKLIAQFPSRLDAAYLSHKIMSAPPEEAERQLVQLIVSHIQGILEEDNVASQANYMAAESWIEEQNKNGIKFRTRIHVNKSNEHAKEQLLKLLKNGVSEAKLDKKNKLFYKQISNLKHEKNKSVLSEITAIFAEKPEEAMSLDRDLSYMLSCKTSYESSTPTLESGTILSQTFEDGTIKYLICIQPACDCVRIPKAGRHFLFLPLLLNKDRFDICIANGQSDALTLKINDKAFEIRTLNFTPQKAQTPIHAIKDHNQWVFTNATSEKYEWIATLKSELVLRLAHSYGKNVSRVGTTESEWQRRWAK
ncbi:MAG: hypothetical protein FDX21_11065 [Chlorobium sp.]|nr:MAG: hypothetical protein FDX21_11065 [Chlorobium sp.]